tara:strand:+ start:9181 stop:9375 length:195 start_codon:yes stop_codon:yes gene_type:complete
MRKTLLERKLTIEAEMDNLNARLSYMKDDMSRDEVKKALDKLRYLISERLDISIKMIIKGQNEN